MPKGYAIDENAKSQKIRAALKGRAVSPKHRARLSMALKGEPRPDLRGNLNPAAHPKNKPALIAGQRRRYAGHRVKVPCPECGTITIKALSDVNRGRRFCSVKCARKWWSGQMRTEEYLRRCVFANLPLRPTKPEKKLVGIINECKLPYKYCGDGSVIIGGLNPDFINTNGEKKLIEVFGDYWHNPENKIPYTSVERNRRAIFYQYGFRMLVIWEKELNTLPEKEIIRRLQEYDEYQSKN